MERRHGFMSHDGKQIFLIDLREMSPQEIIASLEPAAREIRSQPPKSVLTLTCTEGVRLDTAMVEALKQFVHGNTPYVKAAAVVGVSGMQEIVLNIIRIFTRRELKVLRTVEEARNHLTSL